MTDVGLVLVKQIHLPLYDLNDAEVSAAVVNRGCVCK